MKLLRLKFQGLRAKRSFQKQAEVRAWDGSINENFIRRSLRQPQNDKRTSTQRLSAKRKIENRHADWLSK